MLSVKNKASKIRSILSVALSACIIASAGIVANSMITSAETPNTDSYPYFSGNGNFEKGDFTGFEKGGWNSKILEIVTQPKTGDEGKVAVEGTALYFPAANKVDQSQLVAPVNLLPGNYVLQYETTIIGTNSWCSAGFGISTTQNQYWGSAPDQSIVSIDKSNVTFWDCKNNIKHRTKTTNYFYYIEDQNGANDITGKKLVTAKFTVLKAATVYIWFSSHSRAQYLDNIVLYNPDKDDVDFMKNGDFEGNDGSFIEYGATEIISDAKTGDESKVTLTGKAAYVPKSATTNDLVIPVTLTRGSYVWQYETTVIGGTPTGWGYFGGGIAHTLKADNCPYENNYIIGYGADANKGNVITAAYTSLENLAGRDTSKDYIENDKETAFVYWKSGLGADKKRTVTYEFTIGEDFKTVYLWIGSFQAAQYVDNMSLKFAKTLDKTVYDFDDNGQFKTNGINKFFVNSENQAENNGMKIVVVTDPNHGNVLKLPKFSGTDNNNRPASARFYKEMNGLEVGKAYKVSFDLKMDDGNYSAMQWIALAGITRQVKNGNNNFLTYKGTSDQICLLPDKGIFGTSNNQQYSFAADGTNKGVISWNGSTDWATYTVDFVAQDKTAYFYMENYLGKTDLYIDNIQFSESSMNLTGEINDITIDIKTENTKSLLVIGNSFAGDTVYEFNEVLAGVSGETDYRVGRYGKGAQPPSYFTDQINNNRINADFTYSTKSGENTAQNVSFDAVVKALEWDNILVQATTVEYNDNYVNQAKDLVNAVRNKCPNATIYLYVPWNCSKEYLNRNNVKTYGTNTKITTPKQQINEINNYVAALKKAMPEDEGLKYLIVAEELYEVQKLCDNLHRDGLHLNKLGQTALSMTVMHKLFSLDLTDTNAFNFTKTDYRDESWADNDAGTITEKQLALIKSAANGEKAVTGDANYNGEVDITDLVNINKRINNNKYVLGSDMDEDGSVDNNDIAILRRQLLN